VPSWTERGSRHHHRRGSSDARRHALSLNAPVAP
jgi:hypothetical protein